MPSRYRYLLVDFVEENESRFAARLADMKRACVLTCVWKTENISSSNRTYIHVRACTKKGIYHWRQLYRGTMENKGLYLVLDKSLCSLAHRIAPTIFYSLLLTPSSECAFLRLGRTIECESGKKDFLD